MHQYNIQSKIVFILKLSKIFNLSTGKNNVLKQMEKEAKELAFGTSATEVDQLLNAQSESVFLLGPGKSRGSHGHAIK